MKFIFSIILLATLLPAGMSGQSEWKRFQYPEANFRVLSSDSLVYEAKEVKVPIGEITYHTYYLRDKDTADNVFYQVQYFDYPIGTVHHDSLDLVSLIFDENVKAAEKSVFGKLIYAHDFEEFGYPGRLFKIIFKDGVAAIKTKMYIIGNRYYAVSVAGFRNKSLNPSVDVFLDSFFYEPSEELK